MRSNTKIEFGDFQTPQALANQVCALLRRRGIIPDVVLEPPCGLGSFLVAAAECFRGAQLFGWDINADYVQRTRAALNQIGAGARAVVATRDSFKHNWELELGSFRGKVLIQKQMEEPERRP